MLLVGALAVGSALGLMLFLLLDRRTVAAEVPAETVTSAAPVAPVAQSAFAPPAVAELPSLYKRFAGFAAKLTPGGYARRLQHKLDLAGNPGGWAADRVLAFKGIGLVIGAVLGFLFGSKEGAGIFLILPLGAVIGFFLPDVWVKNLGQHRQQEVQNGLPDAIDMMTVCVEAGLGFDSALARVALNLDGPVALEFARVLQEMQFGKSRTEALRGMVDRTDVSELRTFVSSLIQSAELGISVGDVLRAQAGEMRIKRRQRAEERAQKLPVKILLPLVFCILPCVFIVVLGPAVINIVHTFTRLNG
jgi:tight adherence protein C